MRKPLTLEQKARKAKTDKAWREANSERKVATDKAWREANSERKAETMKAWREANKKRMAETDKVWRNANKERTVVSKRIAHWRRKYGLTPEDVLALLHKQSCACRICKTPLDFNCYDQKSNTLMQIDHCHETGKVRSILCRRCNTSIGVVEKLTLAAWDYLAHFHLINGVFDDRADTVDLSQPA